MLTVKTVDNNTMCSVQELCLNLFSTELHSVEFISTSLVSSIISVHSATGLSTNFFSHLQLSSLNTQQHRMIYNIRTHNY